jgi:peptide/nickel transport system substrate-binding protein
VLRGSAVAGMGLAGAALIGCGGDDDDGGDGTATGTAAATGQAGSGVAGTAVATSAPGQVRITPGVYEGHVPATDAEANPAENAKYGGTLQARYLEPPRMDLNRTLSCTIYHTLNYTNNKLLRGKTGATANGDSVEIEPDLAESWEANDDATEFIFNLREGVMTHDKEPTNGREFTSEDVVAGLEMYRAGGSQQDVYAPVVSIEAPDDYTVKVTLDQPLADFPINVASWSFIYMKELVDNEDLRQEIAVGTGPFIQDEWSKNERSVFSRNPNYFEAGLPYLDGVIAQTQNDANTLRAGFQTDNFMDWGPRDQPDLEDMAGQVDDLVAEIYPRTRGANVNGFQFQMNNPTYQDERIRRAMSLAFDRIEYDLARNSGDNQNPEGPYSNAPMPWTYLYDQYPTAAANGPWYQFNPAEASKLMQAAGYSADSRLEVAMPSFYYRSELAELVAPGINQNLPEVNISFREIDNPTHVTLMSDRNFDDTIGFLWGPAGFSMDQWIFPFYHSTGGTNYGSVNDPDLDAMLEAQRAEADLDAKTEIWRQVWDRIHDQVYQAWFPEPLVRVAWHNYVMNYRWHGLMGSYVCYTSDQARTIWLDDGAPGLDR